MNRLIFLPQNHQADPGTLHLARQRRPVGLGIAAGTQLATGCGEQELFDRRIRQISRQRPGEPCQTGSSQIILHRAAAHAHLPGDDPGACLSPKMHLQNLAYPPHGQSLRRHPIPPVDCDGGTRPQVNTDLRDDLLARLPSFQRVAGIRLEWWPPSNR